MTAISKPDAPTEIEDLQARLAEAEGRLAEAQELINAIQSGDVDAVVVSGPQGDQVFTLQGAEYAYRALVEAMNEGAATLGADGTVLYCNQHLSQLLGVPLEQIIGHPAALMLGDAANQFDRLFVHTLCGETGRTEMELHTADGRGIPVYISLRSMNTEDPTAICMVVTDLTEIKESQQALHESESLFSTLANLVPQMVWMSTPDGDNFYVNERWMNYTGLTLAESCGGNWNNVFHPDDKQAAWDAWGQATRTHEQYRIESRLRGADGNYRWFLMRGEPLVDAEGKVIRWFGTCTDIEDLKRSEAELTEHREHLEALITVRTSQLQTANLQLEADMRERESVMKALIESEKLASVGRLASTIAHEINNPLEAVGNALYLATTDPETPPMVKRYLDMATDELERVTHVTHQTLAFHRGNNAPMAVDLCDCLEGVLNLYAGRIKTREITIERRYSTSESIQGVNSEIRQIIANLLSNSLDALDNDGKLACRVTRSVGKGGAPAIRLTIADSGSGIPPENRDKIFEPFFTTKEFVGTGLGLWITKQIVEKHGGTIRMRSRLAKGTVFSIAFPRLNAAW